MSMAVDVVRRFCDLRVLAIGDAILDSYLEGSASRLCREGPVPVVRKTAEEHVPGGAANTAANLRALGAEVIFIGIVGQDAPGRSLRAALRAQGVDDRWLVEDPAASTLHKLRILARSQYVVRFDEGETRSCSSEGQQRLVANLEHAFPLCDLVVVSDYGYGVASEEVNGRLRELRAARPCVLVVDAKDLRRFRHAGATVVTPNQLEALLSVEPGSHYDGAIDIVETERIGQRLLATIDAEYAAITMAGDGVLLVDRHGGPLHLPTRPVTHANDVGAGDSFTAAFALALGADASREEAARIGIEAATIAVAKQRTAVVHHQELLQQVSLHDYDAVSKADDAAVEALAVHLDTERRGLDGHARTIVFTNGVFDILHAGHIHFLRAA
ncbi:MAG: bifunctional heptose 7-phosphate kinase/heptose 1-phosphate adenyltransferase, partial [Chloroflexota bacterium]|nr:bifunctional heptose 7-phosphate kinase/heptose 1-phosphate adenyltransferase [Chloroflexota bacterium]